jgi:hypothetical protein
MTDPGRPDETLTAALIQISGHAERIAALDSRYQELADALSAVAAQVSTAGGGAAGQASVLASLDALEGQVSVLTSRLAELAAVEGEEEDDDGGSRRYQPVPAPRWWKITGPEREDSLARLRAWVSQIYRPSYGLLAALLPSCWEDHPLCLNALDWLSELWSVLYLTAERSPEILAAQAEWQTRLLPAAADQMAAETEACQHTAAASRGLTPRTSSGLARGGPGLTAEQTSPLV